VTVAEILATFEAIGARVTLTPAGVVDVDAPAVPGVEVLLAEIKAQRPEVVEELRRRARDPKHPCGDCQTETDPEDLFCPGCWEKRLGRMPVDVAERRRRLDHARREQRAERLATFVQEAQTAPSLASSAPSKSTGPEGAE
jgi:hypothetical protein